jgi:acetolactate synthase small subunit
MELFKDHVYLCRNADEYKVAVEKALTENTDEKKNERIQFARSHSWKNNVQQIYNQIEKLVN